MAMPCLSQASIDSLSFIEPPGWMIALIPAAAAASTRKEGAGYHKYQQYREQFLHKFSSIKKYLFVYYCRNINILQMILIIFHRRLF